MRGVADNKGWKEAFWWKKTKRKKEKDLDYDHLCFFVPITNTGNR